MTFKSNPGISEVKSYLQKYNCKLIKFYGEIRHKRIIYACSEGHTHELAWITVLKYGERAKTLCKQCYYSPDAEDTVKQPKKNGQTQEKTIDTIKQSFENEKYNVLEISRDQHGRIHMGRKRWNYKILFICPNNHNGQMAWTSWKKGLRCKECLNTQKAKEILQNKELKKCVTITISYS
jgi:hypothetical protein